MIDVDRFRSFDETWIASSVEIIGGGMADIVAPRLRQGIATHAIAAKSSTVRRFLFYTDVTYSDHDVMAVLSSLCLCNRSFGRMVEFCGTNQLLPAEAYPIPCSSSAIPKNWTCSAAEDEGLAVILPVWKRNYMQRMFETIKRQTRQPSRILVFQNEAHRVFDFSKFTEFNFSALHHVWLTNWNSFFYMTYVAMSFMRESYVLKIDDDMFASRRDAFATYLNAAKMQPSSIIGLNGGSVGLERCGFEIEKVVGKTAPDHVANFVLFPAGAGKVMQRFRRFVIFGSEDIAISLTNNMECGTLSWALRIGMDMVFDKLNQRRDGSIRKLYHDMVGREDSTLMYGLSYCYYVCGGYKPRKWVRHTGPNCSRDIRLPWKKD
jgi:hypothetical protein